MYVSAGMYTINIVMQETKQKISRLMEKAEEHKQAGSHDLQGKILTCLL